MPKSDLANIRIPLDWLPAGLISWYAPERKPMALATSWVALICGERTRVRAAWPGLHDSVASSWLGGDFVLNIPDEHCLPLLRRFVARGTYCLDIHLDLGQEIAPGCSVVAPRLPDCAVQIECRNGLVRHEGFEPEIAGDVVLLHRQGVVLEPPELAGFCTLNPLCPVLPRPALQ